MTNYKMIKGFRFMNIVTTDTNTIEELESEWGHKEKTWNVWIVARDYIVDALKDGEMYNLDEGDAWAYGGERMAIDMLRDMNDVGARFTNEG